MPQPPKIDRDQILDAAFGLLEREGPGALSMRNLAAALDVKAPSLYHHFPDKLSLNTALSERGTALLLTKLKHAARSKDAREAFLSTASAYLNFARQHDSIYTLMTEQRDDAPVHTEEGKRLWNFVLSIVGGITGNPDDTNAAVAFWAFLHGFAMLARSGRFGASGPKGGLEAGLHAFLTSWANRT